MSRFLAGFATASALWGIAAALYFTGVLRSEPDVQEPVNAVDLGPVPPGEEDAGRRRRPRRPGSAGGDGEGNIFAEGDIPQGEATTGDDLGENDPQRIDMGSGGGEQRLSAQQIEQAFAPQMSRIRRCLVLAAGENAIRGRLVFGLRIQSSGRAGAVNLSGPAAITTGECGACLRGAAQAVRFPTFNGPDVVARYPVTLE